MNSEKQGKIAYQKPKVTCLIAAYNEEERIGDVLNVVAQVPLIDEIIVVNDGSTDKTAEIVRSFKEVRLIDLSPNRGKAYALKQGISAATGNIIIMLDADLIGLKRENVEKLIKPVLKGEMDMTLSLRRNSLFIYRLMGIDLVSGERAIPKKILKNLKDYEDSRFGFESLLNEYVIENKLKFRVVKWDNVRVAPKHQKMGFWQGIKGELKMIKEIFNAVPVTKWIHTFILMAVRKNSGKKKSHEIV